MPVSIFSESEGTWNWGTDVSAFPIDCSRLTRPSASILLLNLDGGVNNRSITSLTCFLFSFFSMQSGIATVNAVAITLTCCSSNACASPIDVDSHSTQLPMYEQYSK